MAVKGKRANEHVHSQGRVMGDRSVLYKVLSVFSTVLIGLIKTSPFINHINRIFYLILFVGST